MRQLAIAAVGAGSMATAWLAFVLAFSDGSPLAAVTGDASLLVPFIVIAGGVLAAVVDSHPRSYLALLAGGAGAAVAFAAMHGLREGPTSDWLGLAAVGAGLAVSLLTVGFVPTAIVGWVVDHTHDLIS
jgi:hypothetical protein